MNNLEATLARYTPQMLSIFRIVFGLLYLQHGTVKWLGFPAPNPAFANISLLSMVGIAGVIEVFGSLLVIVGLYTRVAAFFISGQMAFTYLIYTNRMARHYAPILNGGTLEVAYCFAFLLLVFAGAGIWSLDSKFRNTP